MGLDIDRVYKNLYRTLDNRNLRDGLKRSVTNISDKVFNILHNYPYLIEYADYIRRVREDTLNNLEYYIDKTLKSIEMNKGYPYYARDRAEVIKILDDIIGDTSKVIVKAKSMISEEIDVRGYLASKGHIVYETDLGELLIQLSKGKPMHAIVPAAHITFENAIEILRNGGINVDRNMSIEEVVYQVRRFLREFFIRADMGISGANAISADTGSILLISNEGNIRASTSLPEIHIVITGVEKILPTLEDAFKQCLVQAGYAGLYPPTYISLISGPSSTADIEFKKVYGVHGPRELHVILYDGGRLNALRDEVLKQQLLCIKCGRCQIECPIWQLVGNICGGRVYGIPMGFGWTAITDSINDIAPYTLFCLRCGLCKEVCPMKIDIPSIVRYIRGRFLRNFLKG